MKKTNFILAFSFALSIVSCTKTTSVEPITEDYKPILENVGNQVIISTYADLDAKTLLLVNALVALENNRTSANLEAARQAWRDTRVPWEQAEGFLFGPVDQQGIDPSIDSWPVNQPDLDAVLASPNTLTKTYIDGLSGTLKGFHTLEYLLFGIDTNKQLSNFTPRQYEYLRACAESLKGATEQLYFAWRADKQNFVRNLVNAGTAGNSMYPSQKSALQELVNGIIKIADEVANGKINDPLSQQNPNLEESRFSANSKADFADNIRSIENVYLGKFQNSTKNIGISSLVKAKNTSLDAKVKQQITEAIQAIEAIEGTFTTAIINAKPSVQQAQQRVRALQQTLESEVAPLISNL